MRELRNKLNLLEDSDLGIIDKKEIKYMAEFVKNNKNFKTNKKKNFNTLKKEKNNHIKRIKIPEFAGELIEYKMSSTLAKNLLKENEGKRPVQEVLCDYVNSQCGFKGYCIRVTYF